MSDSERYPVSFAQQMLCVFDSGDPNSGPFGPHHNITWAWRVGGSVDTAILAASLDEVVARHEVLRTRIVQDGEDLYQQVAPPSPAEVSEVDLSGVADGDRDRRSEELVIELEGQRFGIEPLPLVRAVLGRFDDQDSVLVLIAHHAAVDGWSMQVMANDLASGYARRTGHDVPATPVPTQYRDFAVWQRTEPEEALPAAHLEYWKNKLAGATMVATRMDYPRSANRPVSTSVLRYPVASEISDALTTVARENRATKFMVLLAAYNVLVARRTGITDITVATIGSNRKQARFQDTVGNFTNFIPLRTDLAGCETFQDVLARTRTSCIEAYSKEIPFLVLLSVAPELMSSVATDNDALMAFQPMQLPFTLEGERVGDLELRGVPRRRSQQVGTEIPDGALWQLDVAPTGEIHAYLGYNTHKFTETTMRVMADEFDQVLKDTVLDQHGPLRI